MERYAVGVDIGGTSVKLGLFFADGALWDRWEIPTHTQNGGAEILPEVAASIRLKLAERKLAPERAAGIGLGVPGPVDGETTVHRCVNLGWGVWNLKERMNQLLPEIPEVFAGNDANVAALGELWQGGGKGFHSAVLVTLGTGVGGGVVLNGRIVPGAHGGAGELGHITVNPQEKLPCTCGKCGCLEQYASAAGIVRMARQMLAEGDTPSALRDMERFTAKELCDLARDGEKMASAVLERFGEYLGRALSFVSCTMDPEVFLIGGGMSRAGELLCTAVGKSYRRYAFHVSADTPILLAKLGNDAGIYGCAAMALRGGEAV